MLGLPTTGGSRALVDHRPRLDSRVAAGMRPRRRGDARQGEPRRVSVRRLRHQHRRRDDRQRVRSDAEHRPDRAAARATAVATSLATLGFGTDTCNSLSNPASFASLATIRTTRGLTSRAGVMPLNTFQDAVGPIAKSIRELALVLDQVTGPDAEDEATADAAPPHRRVVRRRPRSRPRSRARASASCASCLSASPASARPPRRWKPSSRSCARPARPSSTSRSRISTRAIVQARGSAPGSLKAGWTVVPDARREGRANRCSRSRACWRRASWRRSARGGCVTRCSRRRPATSCARRRRSSTRRATSSGRCSSTRWSSSGSTRCCIPRTWRGRTRTKAGSSATAKSRAPVRKAR